MSKYRIIMDGKTYEMEVILMDGDHAAEPAAKNPPKEQKAAVSAPDRNASAAPAQKPVTGGAGAVTAPMPGTVNRIDKAVGDPVKAGEVVMILEAMKMENEILAPVDGTITELCCTAGGTVAGGAVLFRIG